jgi:hypothetical protein
MQLLGKCPQVPSDPIQVTKKEEPKIKIDQINPETLLKASLPKIKQIFESYSYINDKCKGYRLKKCKLIKLLKDCEIISNGDSSSCPLTLSSVDIAYAKAVNSNADMTFDHFLIFLRNLSVVLYPKADMESAVAQLTNILDRLDLDAPVLEISKLFQAIESDDIVNILPEAYGWHIRKITTAIISLLLQ